MGKQKCIFTAGQKGYERELLCLGTIFACIRCGKDLGVHGRAAKPLREGK
jgi:hypothetical protein